MRETLSACREVASASPDLADPAPPPLNRVVQDAPRHSAMSQPAAREQHR